MLGSVCGQLHFAQVTFRHFLCIFQLKQLRLKLMESVFSVKSWEVSGEGRVAARTHMEAMRFIVFVMDVRKVGHSLIATVRTTNTFKEPVRATARAPQLLLVTVERRIGDRCNRGFSATNGASKRSIVMRRISLGLGNKATAFVSGFV